MAVAPTHPVCRWLLPANESRAQQSWLLNMPEPQAALHSTVIRRCRLSRSLTDSQPNCHVFHAANSGEPLESRYGKHHDANHRPTRTDLPARRLRAVVFGKTHGDLTCVPDYELTRRSSHGLGGHHDSGLVSLGTQRRLGLDRPLQSDSNRSPSSGRARSISARPVGAHSVGIRVKRAEFASAICSSTRLTEMYDSRIRGGNHPAAILSDSSAANAFVNVSGNG